MSHLSVALTKEANSIDKKGDAITKPYLTNRNLLIAQNLCQLMIKCC